MSLKISKNTLGQKKIYALRSNPGVPPDGFPAGLWMRNGQGIVAGHGGSHTVKLTSWGEAHLSSENREVVSKLGSVSRAWACWARHISAGLKPRTRLSRRGHACGLLGGSRVLPAPESGRVSSQNSPCHCGQGTLLGQTRL